MIELICGVLAIILTLVRLIIQAKADKEKNKAEITYENDMQTFSDALANNNTDVLSELFDELRVPANPDSGNTGRPNDKTARKR